MANRINWYSIIFIVVGLLVFSSNGHSQKFEKSIDKFTGKILYYTPFETIYRKLGSNGDAGEKVSFSYLKVNDSIFLYLSLRIGGNRLFSINENQTLYLKPVNGESIKIQASTNQISNLDPSNNVQATYISQTYFLGDNELQILRSSKIEAIRIEHISGNLDFEIKDKYSSLFSKLLIQK